MTPQNHDKALRNALKEKVKEVENANDPKEANNVAAAIESLICKHHMPESYTQIKRVTRPHSGGGKQQVDVPK